MGDRGAIEPAGAQRAAADRAEVVAAPHPILGHRKGDGVALAVAVLVGTDGPQHLAGRGVDARHRARLLERFRVLVHALGDQDGAVVAEPQHASGRDRRHDEIVGDLERDGIDDAQVGAGATDEQSPVG